MSSAKSKRAECSPRAPKPLERKEPKYRFELSQLTLEKLKCFTRKQSVKADKKRMGRIKSTASGLGRPEADRLLSDLAQEQAESLEPTCADERTRRASEQCSQQRKKEQSTSPDLPKALMNEVIYKIETEGVKAEWKEDEHRRGEESGSEMENLMGECQRIWRPSLPSIEEADKSFVSTEGGTVRSPNASARNSYYGGSPYIMMPMQHFSFNNSFSYGSEEKLYPDYYAYKWNEKNDMINKRIFEINYDVIEKDPRTTVMIKNIPNKYSLKLLSDEIDEKHANTYDFLYLPFDFDNNCNVGYAFINFLSLDYLRAFYESFNGKKWLKFRSVKICALTYARLQGRNSLIEHFHNSKVLNQKEKRFRPIIKEMSKLSDLLENQRRSQLKQ